MAVADAAVLRAVQDTLLHPAVVRRALAHAEELLTVDRSAGQREALESQLSEVDVASRRLTAAIAKGGELAPLVAALDTYDGRRRVLEARLKELRAPRPAFDPATVRRSLESYLADWQGLLCGHVGQAQQVLRRLIKGRLTLVPQAAGYYAFTGAGTVRPVLSGAIRNLASLTGFEPVLPP